MLVLKRKAEERVIVTMPDGRRMSLVVTDIRGDSVWLGFDAPADVTIHRWEIQQRIEAGEEVRARLGKGGAE